MYMKIQAKGMDDFECKLPGKLLHLPAEQETFDLKINGEQKFFYVEKKHYQFDAFTVVLICKWLERGCQKESYGINW